MKKYILIFLFSIIGFNISLNAQVTIGTTKKPADYSILELDASEIKGGLLLPRLNARQQIDLKTYLSQLADPTEAKGLVIYDTDDHKMKYWTGSDWAKIDQEHHLVGKNGVIAIDELRGGVKLGGELTDEQTIVNIGSNMLSLSGNDANSKFMVTFGDDTNNPSLIIKNKKVGIGTTDPQVQLDIKSQNPTSLTEKPLRISGSKEAPNSILVSNRDGYALWQPFMPVSSVISGTLYDGGQAGNEVFGYYADYSSSNKVATPEKENRNLTRKSISVGRGKWLIVAKYSSYTHAYTSNTTTQKDICDQGCPHEFYHYIKLLVKKPSRDWQELTVMGTLPEETYNYYTNADGSGENRHYASPQLFYYYENDTDDDHELAIWGSTSKQAFLSERYGGPFFQALRIDGLLSTAVVNEGKVECNLSGTTSFDMETGDEIDQVLSGYLRFTLENGTLALEDDEEIGSKNGLKLRVVGGPYDLQSNVPMNVQVKVKGRLTSGVTSGTFGIPVRINNATFPYPDKNCDVVSVNVLTKGVLDASRYDKNQYSGKGRSFTVQKNLSFELASGSVVLSPGDVLGSAYGITATFAGANPVTYISIGSYVDYIPVEYSGTVESSAPATFVVPIQLTGTTATEVPPVDGLIVNVVEGSIDCGEGVKTPSNISVSTSGKINLSLASSSGPYKLDYNTILGTTGSGITVKYAGTTRILETGSTTELDVTYVSNSVLPTGTYSIPLTFLYGNGVNIADCVANVTVEDYGMFNCSSLNAYAVQGVSEEDVLIEAPLDIIVDNGTVTINAGDILGEVTYLGNKYEVKAINSMTLSGTSDNPENNTVNIRISGKAITSPGNFTIMLNKKPGVRSCSLNMVFKVFGAFDCSTISPVVNIGLPVESVSEDRVIGLSVSDEKVQLKAGDILGEVRRNNMSFKVVVVNSVTVSSGSSSNVDVRILGTGTFSPAVFSIPLDKVKGVESCNVEISITE